MRETCELALRSLQEKDLVPAEKEEKISPIFKTIDPISKKNTTIKGAGLAELRSILLDEKSPLYDRYEALFALRDMNSNEANDAIIESMSDGVSALFRHEVLFYSIFVQLLLLSGGIRIGTNSKSKINISVGQMSIRFE